MLLIFKQLYNFFSRKLPRREGFASGSVAQPKIKYDLKDLQLVKTTCSYVPRILDFLFVCTPTLDSLFEVYNLHTIVCRSCQKAIEDNCPVVEPSSDARHCDRNVIVSLHDEHGLEEFNNVYTYGDYQEIGQHFYFYGFHDYK